MLNKKDAANIINLNPYDSVDPDIASRQFEVIVKAFNHLSKDENCFIYIADEVGLGKTYIAMGIATLLRRFCPPERRALYKDVIFVPKQNLQNKWLKEINNFIAHNYLEDCNIVKSVLGSPVGNCGPNSIHHYLNIFEIDSPSYEIYRNSSFSIATSSEAIDWQQKLEDQVSVEFKHIFKKGRKVFGKKIENDILIKRLYAFILNLSFPVIDLLIVDEAHNFKHGIGNDVAIRNQIVSRILGNISEEDEILFNLIPELDRNKINAKAKKVIFLSATPIDNGLYELKQQFDCFLPNHLFKESLDIEKDIKDSLSSFMIRGLMNITLSHKIEGEEKVSRNMYRHEHRRGNVVKAKEAPPQYIDDNLESIVLGLMQFKTLNHLKESNNNSFEIGMLAAFESFKTKGSTEIEYEETANRSTTRSVDQNVIEGIAESYFGQFKTHLPHPKQDNLVNVLFEGIKSQTKSLVFVRRIASVIELERKLINKVEEWQFEKIKKYLRKSRELGLLAQAFDQRHDIQKIEGVLELLGEKILSGNKSHFKNLIQEEGDILVILKEYLLFLYYSEDLNENSKQFKKLVFEHIYRNSIRTELRSVAFELLTSHILDYNKLSQNEKEQQLIELEEETSSYIFSAYFSTKRYPAGFNFRKRFGTKDWYKFNYFHLNGLNEKLHFDTSGLTKISFDEKIKNPSQKMDIINERLLDGMAHFNQSKLIPNYSIVDPILNKKTFLNLLLEGPLKNEYHQWLDKKLKQVSKGYTFIDDLDSLVDILQGVFRNGSGLLPAYIAESLNSEEFESKLLKILQSDFPEVLYELKTILVDFDKIISTNFSDRSKIQHTLYNQYPVTGASGHHKRDISRLASQFRMPGFPYVLITTDVLKEGEDLHLYCKDVYHYGIAWNPSDMEQRTGRIDRINSSCYFDLKKDGRRTFENSLQVFYPYLADTLEVNQVAKVFNKMNDFIQTFYDISVKREKDSQVSTDDIVQSIPLQITELLTSKYDHDNGQWPEYQGQTSYDLSLIGMKREELETILYNTLETVKEFKNFTIYPFILDNSLMIRANINLDGRRAPLRLQLVKGQGFDSVVFAIESMIGRCTHSELRKREVRQAIQQALADESMELIENNDQLLARKTKNIHTPQQELLTAIKTVLTLADQLENKYTAGDEDGF